MAHDLADEPTGGAAERELAVAWPTSEPRQVGDELYAKTYDAMQVAWPDELATYVSLAREVASGRSPIVLELASGTGRVAIPLADAGCDVWALDRSPTMLEIARSKRSGANPRWIHGDMRDFELDVRADLALIPAHSFQFMLTADDQLQTLVAIHRHLQDGGRLAVHVELPGRDWLAALPEVAAAPSERPAFTLRDTTTDAEWEGHYAMTLDRLAEVVTYYADWLRVDDGEVVEHVRQVEMSLKVLGVLEMEHALRRAGFDVVELREWAAGTSTSSGARELLWIARPGNAS